MSNSMYKIVESHPRLGWVTDARKKFGLGQSTPAHTAQELSKVQSKNAAAGFVRSAGLKVDTISGSKTAYEVSLDFQTEYKRPVIVLPTAEREVIPFGSVSMSCLLLEISEPLEAEEILSTYQQMVIALSRRMQSIPSFCITGHKNTKNPPHDLYNRGFRFFFSPKPEMLLGKIVEMFEIYNKILNNTDPDIKPELGKAYTNAKLSHTVLDDVMPYSSGTLVVDLRRN